ncbi:MAG: TRAP transporter substrate-binding protein DctP [Clostridiales Family XIII bacterium]|jgi:TRAP-type C4-dicarboxylate transport system substrate-binding protein|nr:TRAP transporter substrate-binding protein DctP [Clostridiales Family XIII bacterium]
MKRSKLYLAVAMALALILVFGACGSPSSSTQQEAPPADTGAAEVQPESSEADGQADWVTLDLKYATYLPDSNPMAKITIGNIQAELDKAMPGKITITIYPSGTLLGQNDIYDGILTGTCDIGLIDYATVMNRFPVTQLFGMPGAIPNPRGIVASQVLTEWAQTTAAAEYNDVVFLWGTGNGPMCFFTKSRIDSIADLKGKQIRASAVFGETVKAYGATPVTMDTSEVYEAVRNGLLEGMYNVFPAAANMNLDELGKNALINPLDTFVQGTIMSRTALEKMPESQQEAFLAAVKTAFDSNVTAMERNEKVGRIAEAAKNCDIVILGGADLEAYRAASADILDDYLKQLDDKGLNGTAELEKIRELSEKYSEKYSWQDYADNFLGDEFIEH